VLVEKGVLDLAEPVDELLPELADRRVLRRLDGPLDDTVPAGRRITTEDLLTFRMGHGLITEPAFNPPYPIIVAADELQLIMAQPDPRTPHAPDEWIRRFGTLPLMDQPGTRWRYNTGSLVLGVLVARAAAMPLGDVLRELIFEPLGMRETGFWLPAERAHRLPGHYMSDFQGGAIELQQFSRPQEWTRPPVFPSGAAGLLSTADDYLSFARMLLHNGAHEGKQLLSEQSVATMTSNKLPPEQLASAGMLLAGKGWGYGMAVTVAPDEASPAPGRYGWDGGYGSVWCNDPNRGVIAIALTQTSDFLFNGGAAEFTKLALN